MGSFSAKLSPEITTMSNSRNNSENVIDLTECSFTLADHNRLNNVVINLDTDESLRVENTERTRPRRGRKRQHSKSRAAINPETTVDLCTPEVKTKPKRSRKKSGKMIITEEPEEKKAKQSLGTCPICFEDFCGQALASTKCGHVFCLACLEKALKNKIDPRCPTCRTSLKGKSKYHPIFL